MPTRTGGGVGSIVDAGTFDSVGTDGLEEEEEGEEERGDKELLVFVSLFSLPSWLALRWFSLLRFLHLSRARFLFHRLSRPFSFSLPMNQGGMLSKSCCGVDQ